MQVLLYNFFEDSAVDISRWRVLLNHAEGIVDSQDLAAVHAPSFGRDEGRFAGVYSEVREWIRKFVNLPLTLLTVEIAILGRHQSKEELVDLRQV